MLDSSGLYAENDFISAYNHYSGIHFGFIEPGKVPRRAC
jgi:hypothetical protein